MTETKKRLIEVQKKISELDEIKSEYILVEQKRDDLEVSINKLLKRLEEKNSEINSLEKFSIGGAIKSIFIDKNKTLEQKRDEYYALSQKYDREKIEKASVDYEFKILNKKLNSLTKFKKEFEYLIELRAKELLNENSSQGHSLRQILQDYEEERELNKNLNITAVLIDKVLNRLTLLSAAFREVESYISWNRPRMRNYSFNKRQAINRAKELNIESKLLLTELEKSFRKINYTYRTLDLQLVNFENIIGMFFDNIISDFILRQNLSNAVAEVESVYQKSKRIKKDILNLLKKSEKNLNRLNEVRESIILDN